MPCSNAFGASQAEQEQDPEVLADAILEAIEGEGDRAERLRVAQRHTWAASAKATAGVYAKLCG